LFLRDRYLQIDNTRVRYWQAGQDGTPVLLVHGFGASVEWWERNVAALAACHSVYALDLPGFGCSERLPRALSLSMAAVFLERFLSAVDAPRVHLVGNSLGGLIAMQFAVQFPEAVERLVLVSPAGFTRSIHWVFRLLLIPLLGPWLLRPNWRKLEMFHRRFIHADSSWLTAEWLDRVYALSVLPGASQMSLDVAQMGLNLSGIKASVLRPLHDKLPALNAPTLIAWGDRDRLVPSEQAQIGRHLLPNARVHIFPGCGHCPQLECAAEFNALLLQFLSPQAAP
jgi:pimeloyl-ACP methyl ester carboxylesterase